MLALHNLKEDPLADGLALELPIQWTSMCSSIRRSKGGAERPYSRPTGVQQDVNDRSSERAKQSPKTSKTTSNLRKKTQNPPFAAYRKPKREFS